MVIYWQKKDFRLLDNSALIKAMEISYKYKLNFLPIFGLETDLIEDQRSKYEFGTFYQYGLASAVIPLYKNYRFNQIQSGVYFDPIIKYLKKINDINKIQFLVSHQEHGTNNTYCRDKNVKEFCKNNSIHWIEIPTSGVVRNLDSRDIRDLYVKNYLNGKILPIPNFEHIKQSKLLIESISEDTKENLNKLKAVISSSSLNNDLANTSENNGLSYLDDFLKNRSKNYVGSISSPNTALVYGSRLSQYLAYGTLSLRYVYQSFWKQIKSTDEKKIKRGLLTAMKRLYWREHFIQRIETSPDLPSKSINIDYQNINYSHDISLFEAYKKGETGEPLIDACIRCLNKTGFINFRMRSMLLSYAVYGLDLDWREVGKFLATRFLDYEPGIHWSQVQMQAGITGINTIRVYSPAKQLKDQDKDCIFVKKWINELKNISNDYILNYNDVDLNFLTEGKYPSPIVNFKIQSKLNKDKIYNIRKRSNKENAKATFIKHGSRKMSSKKKKITPKKKGSFEEDSNTLF